MTKVTNISIERAISDSLPEEMTPKNTLMLESMDNEALSILKSEEGEVRRDDAAIRLADQLRGEGVEVDLSEEGEVSISALWNGLVVYDEESIHKINEKSGWIVAAAADRVAVKKGEKVAGIGLVPLTMGERQVNRVLEEVHPISVFPFAPLKTALVTSAKEPRNGRTRDGFSPKLQKKLAAFGTTLMGQRVVREEEGEIGEAILSFIDEGADLVITTGALTGDPDCQAALAIASIADDVRFRGLPVIPGASLMLAIRGEAKIIGASASVTRHEWTSLDPVLLRIFAGLIPTAKEVSRWGAGGLCRKCRECNYPYCHFAAR